MLARPAFGFCLRKLSHSAVLANKVKLDQTSDKPAGWDEAEPYHSVPGPKPLRIFGNAWRFAFGAYANNINEMPRLLHEKYGDIVLLRNLVTLPDILYIYDIKEIEKFYRNEGIWPMTLQFKTWNHYRTVMRKEVFGDVGGLVTVNGEPWQRFRSTVNPVLMQPRTAEHYIGAMNSVADDFIERINILRTANSSGEMPGDFHDELNKYAFEAIGVVALDRRFGCLDATPNAEAVQMVEYMVELFSIMQFLEFTPMGKYYIKYNTKMWRTFVRNQDYFTNMTLKYIDEAIERIKNTEGYENKPEHEKSAFEKLLQKDKKIAMVMTLDMLTAGIESTGKILCAALYFLAKYPEIQNKLRAELLEVIPNKNTAMTKEILAQLPYLKAVIKETTRIAPISFVNARITNKPMVVSGYQIPPGIIAMFPHLYLSTNDTHHKRSKDFIPERWFRDGEYYKTVSPFVSLPFGFGARSCIGKRIALMEIEMLTAKIIRNFTLEWPHADMTFGLKLLYGVQDPLKLHIKNLEQ